MRHQKRHRAALPRRTITTLWLLTVLFIGCAAFGAFSLATSLTSYEFGNAHYTQLRSVAEITPRPTPTPSPTPDQNIVTVMLASDAANQPQTPTQVPTATPYASPTPEPINFEALAKINSDLIAWIRLPGTVIDYPVVQTNNNTRYLSHLFDGTSNQLGSLFMDYENKGRFNDQHILIYGHDMQDGSMFGTLENYANSAYYESHPEAMIYLPDGSIYKLEIFAAARMAAFRSELPVSFGSDDEFLAYVDKIRSLSAFSTDIRIGADDSVVSLCTCVSDSTDYRFIVSGKLTQLS